MEKMITEFGTRLKNVILRLHEIQPNAETKTFTVVERHNRQRTDSMQSQPFSVSSNEGSESGTKYMTWIRRLLVNADNGGTGGHEPERLASVKDWLAKRRLRFRKMIGRS
jgi:hypothetical protein